MISIPGHLVFMRFMKVARERKKGGGHKEVINRHGTFEHS